MAASYRDCPAQSIRAPPGCAPDAVALGPVCVDKYEGSVWAVPDDRPDIVGRIKAGTITKADLLAAGATQAREASTEGCHFDEYPPTFPLDGRYTAPLYAVSIPGVLPSNCITVRQATAACNLAGKRLLTGSEWYHAAAGTPMPDQDDLTTTCALGTYTPVPTGSRAACVSTIGVHDMLGNLYEWTNVFETTLDVEGRAWIIGAAFHVGTGFDGYPASLSPTIAVHTDTGFRCAR